MKTRLSIKKALMPKCLSFAFCFITCFLTSIVSFAQEHFKVSGTVTTAEDGSPLIGVTVMEKGTTNGTITNVDGNYALSVSEGATLIYSFVGFHREELPVGARSTIDIALMPDIQALDEIVVVGYGTVQKSDVTGAVVSLKAEDMTPGANLSVEQMIQGRAAGVTIRAKSGEPGGAISVKIRGASSVNAGNDPLYVIDGMPFDMVPPISGSGQGLASSPNQRNPLNALNPNDIESIEILKDASATAIYGSRGANGVVLITTKSGSSEGFQINYGYTYSLQEIAKKQEMLNAHQYQEVLNGILDDGGFFGESRVADFQGDGIMWPELLYRDGSVQEHNLSFNGGNENTNYFVSLNYFDQEGILVNSGIDRYNARVNLNTGKKEKYNIGLNLNTTFIKDQFASNGVGVNDHGGALYAALNYDPTITRVIDPFTGRYTLSEHIIMDNPMALARGEQASAKTNRTYGALFGEYFIFPALSAKVKIGGNITNSRREVWVDPITIAGQPFGGLATIINSTRSNILGEFTINYHKDFENHSVNAVVGTTYEEYNQFNNDGRGSGFLYPDLTVNGIGSGVDSLQYVGSSRTQYKLNSYLGRINYALMDKYLLTVSARLDGSSRFGDNNKYGFFPSAAVAWKIHQEDFLLNNKVLSQLKLRASYGIIGNQAIGNYRYITSFSIPGNRQAYLGGVLHPIIEPSRAANQDLRWESSRQLDIGFDFGWFNDRLQGSIEYYQRDSRDLLLDVPQPTSNGYEVRMENVGSISNKGLEFMLHAHVLDKGAFRWDINGNFSTLKNEVKDLGEVGTFYRGDVGGFVSNATIIKEGAPMFSFFGHVIEGVWQEGDDFSESKQNVSPGDWKYKDVNGDSIINAEDRVILGDPYPDFTWGLTNTFSYKGLSLNLFIAGSHGNSLYNFNLSDSFFPFDFRRNKIAEPYLNRWTPENPTNEYASFVNPESQGRNYVNSKTVEDASFIRLQSVRLSYDLPVDQLGLNFVKSFNIYVTGQNLLTITDYSGVDPATNSFGNDLIPMDINSYPFSKTYSIGLNVGF